MALDRRACALVKIFWQFVTAVFVLQASVTSSYATPRPFNKGAVPAQLQEWVSWIQERHPEWRCASGDGGKVCLWPGTVALRIKDREVEFSLTAELLDIGELPLPGSFELPPHNLQVTRGDGESVAPVVTSGENFYKLQLTPGSYKVSGTLLWESAPKEIPVPDEFALVTIDGVSSSAVKRRGGMVWSGEEEATGEGNALFLSVMRKLSDQSPLTVETRLVFRVSGAARSVNVGVVIPKNSTPVSVEASVPHQLTADGALSLQLSPGTHEVRVTSLLAQPAEQIATVEPTFSEWPKEEIWTWFPATSFRTVEIQDAQPVTSDLTLLPPDWQGGAGYVVPSGGSITLRELRRGEDRPEANVLSLSRNVWLDLDGRGFTAEDIFQGSMNQGFRLSSAPELALGRATVDGRPALISKSPADGSPGIELRTQVLNATAVSRFKRSDSYSATGWRDTFQNVSTSLHLPPAWSLIHVSGAQSVSSSWVESWSLLDLFISLLIVISTARLVDRRAAALLAVSLLLNHGEFLEPKMLLIHLLVGILWVSLAREGSQFWQQSGSWFLRATLIVWLLQILTFTKLQLTQVLFPQLQAGTRYRTALQEIYLALEGSFITWPAVALSLVFGILGVRWILRAASVGKGLLRFIGFGFIFFLIVPAIFTSLTLFATRPMTRSASFDGAYPVAPQYQEANSFQKGRMAMDELSSVATEGVGYEAGGAGAPEDARKIELNTPKKVVQSGPATPSWRWRTFVFSFAGPVAPEKHFSLYLLSPTENRVLSVIRVLILFVLAAFFLRKAEARLDIPLPSGMTATVPLGLLALALSVALLSPKFVQVASAEYPPANLLQELEERLTAEQCSADSCTTLRHLGIAVSANIVNLTLEASSAELGSIALPGPLDQLVIDEVSVDGKPTLALRRDESGYLMVRIPAGKSVIQAKGKLSPHAVTTLQFKTLPLVTTFSGEGWELEGLLPTGVIKGALRLIPKNEKGETKKFEAVILPSWFSVVRSLSVGEESSVTTSVTRLGDARYGASVRVPLLPGERVLSGGTAVEGDEVVIRIPAGNTVAQYESSLALAEGMELVAKPTPLVSETWQVDCSPHVQCSFAGLRPTQTVVDGMWHPLWHPFPGEKVELKVIPLAGVPGDTLTVDTATHSIRWGSQLLEGSVILSARATKQSSFKISAPAGSTLKSTILDGQTGRAVEEKQDVTFLLNPGAHSVQVNYTLPWEPSIHEVAPQVQLSAEASNVNIEIAPSHDRWLLWVGGLPWGPAVLFWSKLLFLIAAVLVCRRSGVIDISRASAVLLAVGLTTLPMVLVLIPILWLSGHVLIPRFESTLMRVKPFLTLSLFLGVTLVALLLLYEVVQSGLIIQPPMLIVGNSSTASLLRWYTDHATSPLPQPWVLSLPIWCWRAVMLVWSTWLAVALVSWLKDSLHTVKRVNSWNQTVTPQVNVNSGE